MRLMADVFLPQHPGETISMTDPGTASPARLTPYPSAPGELKASVAGEL
jgi:hypothetical protein